MSGNSAHGLLRTARHFGFGRRRRSASICCWKSPSLRRGEDGWFSADISGIKAGARYKFRIDDEIDVPDPASAFQPEDVFGPSEVIDHASFAGALGLARPTVAGNRLLEPMSAPLRRKAPTAPDRQARPSGGCRHHRAGTDAARRFLRRAQLGL